MRKPGFVATRWLGVGLASVLAVVTLGLALTGRLGLYINPDGSWFAVGMAVFVLIGAVASFALPLGAEAEHGHDHGDGHGHDHHHDHDHGDDHHHDHHHDHGDDHDHEAEAFRLASLARRPAHAAADARAEADDHDHPRAAGPRHPVALAATVTGGALATCIVALTLVLPPASLSAELAMSRDVGAPPLFAGADAVTLAATGDTASFGIGEWSAVFATATNPDAFDGEPVTLTGFVTPGTDFALTRLIITHCVIDAQPASVSIASPVPAPDTGQWVTVSGTVRSSPDGELRIEAASVEVVPEPEDPYEY